MKNTQQKAEKQAELRRCLILAFVSQITFVNQCSCKYNLCSKYWCFLYVYDKEWNITCILYSSSFDLYSFLCLLLSLMSHDLQSTFTKLQKSNLLCSLNLRPH